MVRALTRTEAVEADTGSEQLVSAAMRASAYGAARLRVPASVGVKVGVGNAVENTKQTAVSMDRFHVPSSIGVQGIAVTTPQRTGGIQTRDSDWTATGLATSIANDVGAQTEADQVQLVPVATSIVEQPYQEVSEELANARYTARCGKVIGIGQSTPVYNDYVAVFNGEECVSYSRVDI